MIKLYDRQAALDYAKIWSFKRNPKYYDFSNIGGDCTNFISQCLYAACQTMNYTPTTGWYYNSTSSRSASWTGVTFLYQFLITNKTKGPFATEVSAPEFLLPGDIIQFGNPDKGWHHSLLVLSSAPTYDEVYIATHSYDAYNRLLSTYDFTMIRFLHIEGIYI